MARKVGWKAGRRGVVGAKVSCCACVCSVMQPVSETPKGEWAEDSMGWSRMAGSSSRPPWEEQR